MSGVSSSEDVDIDLARLFKAIWERRYRIGIATLGVAALAFAGASLITPNYRSEAQILIELRSPDYSVGNQTQAANTDPVLDELGIASQVQLLQSADLIKQVAKEMKLHELNEFDPDANPSFLKTLAISFGLAKNPLDVPPEERVIKEFREKLTVFQIEKSRVIGIQFNSEDPKLAAAIPNKMADVYFALQSGAKLDSNNDAARWLEPEIANLREKVREAEAKVAAYRSSSDLLRTGTDQTFAGQQLGDISAEIARVRGEKANAEAKAQSVRAALSSGGSVDTLADVVGSPVVQRLKEQEATIQGQIADLSTSLLEGHPRLKGLRGQLTGVQRQIESETRKILASLESEAKVGALREQQLMAQLNSLKADSARAGEEEVGLNALEREAKAQRELLETYLARYREAASRVGGSATPADARIISQAIEPTEVNFPKKLPITIVAALATFLIYSVVIMLGELFSGRAWKDTAPSRSHREDDEAVVVANAPVAATRPAAKAPAARGVADNEEFGSAEPSREFSADVWRNERPANVQMASLVPPSENPEVEDRAQGTVEPEEEAEFSVGAVANHLVDNAVPVAICVSPFGDAGSALSVELARKISAKGFRSVLIDMTGSGYPSRLMAESPRFAGITDILAGQARIADCIHSDRRTEAHIIPQGVANAAKAMRSADRIPMIVDALTEAYDCVIIECGPAEATGIHRLTRNPHTEIVLAAADVNEDDVLQVMTAFSAAGYDEAVLMTGKTVEEKATPRGRRGRGAA